MPNYYDDHGRSYSAEAIARSVKEAGPKVINGEPDPEGVNIITGKRAGSALRDRYLNHIGAMFAAGYMSKDEHDARTKVVQEKDALSEHMLLKLIADLPPLPEPTIAQSIPRTRAAAQNMVSALTWSQFTGKQRVGVYIASILAGAIMAFGTPVVIGQLGPHHWNPLTVAVTVGAILGGIAWVVFMVVLLCTDKRVLEL
jgi:hypothetical protein